MKNIFLTLTILFLISCSQKEGCIDQSACNFDSSADIDDGSCIYNDESFYSYDCLGECLSDADEDGNCDNSYSINSIVEIYNDSTLINTKIIDLDILNFRGIDLTFNNNGKLTNRYLIDSIYYIIDSTYTIDTTHVLVDEIAIGEWTIEINGNGTFLKTADSYHYPYSIEFETNTCINWFNFINPIACTTLDEELDSMLDECTQTECEEAGYWWETDQGIGNQSKEYKLTDDGIVEIIETLNNNYIHIKWSKN